MNCMLGGTIYEDPVFTGPDNESAWGFVKLHSTYGLKLPDGSYTDAEQIIQLVADVPHHVKTLREFVKRGKAIICSTYYRTWESGGQTHHGFFIKAIVFAKANWGAEQQNGYPGLPH